MSRNVRVLKCSPDDVFAVIADGWLFPSWVVGASRMREVDEGWPTPGTELHHSFGVWPAVIDDTTSSIEWNPPHRAVLKARGWPIGEALVVVDVKPRGEDTVVRIQEDAVAGPGTLVPKPLLDLALYIRNRETLHRLAYLAEGRAHRSERSTAEREISEGSE
ncbi:SRPBCC family protein [Microbacterium sp. P05]|uniref:SRPBCC family protein n=1 Tax=Microbacterium sp. P05 TaxID=3366948 RepID=UPI0037450C60